MLRIASLSINGLKAADRDIALAPLNLITGPVGAGKSSVADALRFLALGHVPAVGKTAAATSALMRNGELSVEAVLSDGRILRRTLTRKGGSLKGGAFDSALPPKTGAEEAGASITCLFGASALEAAESLDLRVLLAATPSDRARRIEALLDATGIAPDALARRGRALTVARLAELDPARLPAAQDACELMVQALLSSLPPAAREVAGEVAGLLEASGLAVTLERVNAAKRDHGAGVKAKVATRAELEARLAAAGGDVDPEPIQAERDAIAGSRARLERDLEEAERVRATRAQAEASLPALREAVSQAERDLEAATGSLPRAEQAREEVLAIVDPPTVIAPEAVAPSAEDLARAEAYDQAAAQLEEQAAAVQEPAEIPVPATVEPDQALLKAAADLEAEALRLRAEARAIVLADALTTQAEEIAVSLADGRHRDAERSPWRQVEAVAADLDSVREGFELTGIAMPRLAAPVATLRTLAATHGGEVETLARALDRARFALKEARAKADARETERKALFDRRADLETRAAAVELQAREAKALALDKARAEAEEAGRLYRAAVATRMAAAEHARATREALRSDAQAARTKAASIRQAALEQAEAANRAARDAYAAAFGSRASQVEMNRARRERLAKEADYLVTLAAEQQVKRDLARADLGEAEARLAGIASVSVDETGAREELLEVAKALESIEVRLGVARSCAARRQEMQALIGEIEHVTALERAYTAAEWAAKKLRDEDLAARASGIEGRMRTFLRAAGRSEEPFLRSGKAGAEFGWRRGGQEIAIEALSGGETVLFSAGLASAVIAMRAPALSVLLVEAAELGIEAAPALLRGLEAVSGEIGNVIVASCLPISAPAGWSVLHVAERTEVAA